MSENPYQASHANIPASASYDGQTQLHPMEPLYRAAGWVLIVMGVLNCLTIVGAIFGWVPIWMGILLKGTGEKLRQGFNSGDNAILAQASKDLGTYFTIMGIFTMIGLILGFLYFAMVILIIVGSAVTAAR